MGFLDFMLFLVKVAALALTLSVFVMGVINFAIDRYFEQKEKFITLVLNKVAAGLEAGMKGVESLIKR